MEQECQPEPEYEPDKASIDRYRLSDDDSRELTRHLLESNPIKTRSSIVCYEIAGDSEEADVARSVEARVFKETFDEGPERMAKIYGKYDSASHFYLSIDRRTGEPVGALRVIENSDVGLMTVNTLVNAKKPPEGVGVDNQSVIMERYGIQSLDDCWDIGTVAVPRKHRKESKRKQGRLISAQLYRAMYVNAREQGIDHLVSIIYTRALQRMRDYLGIPFQDMTKPFEFEGSKENIAVYGYLPEFYDKMRKKSLGARGVLAARDLWPLVFGLHHDRAIKWRDIKSKPFTLK